MNLQILSCFWGEKHFDLWQKAAFKSLCFAANRKALRGSTWNIFTDKEFHVAIGELFDLWLPDTKVELYDSTDLRDYIDVNQSAFIKTIQICLDEKERLLLAPPDSIFGDGSIRALKVLGREEYSVVVVPHVRVLPEFLDWTGPNGLSWNNPQLVKRAFEYLHPAWENAEVGHPMQSSYVGGVEWVKLEPNLYSVTHRLPSPYLLDLKQSDLDYFKMQGSFGNFDHTFPGEVLIPQGRQRYAASSDACFIVEVTDRDKNVPPIIPNQPKTGFWKNHYHNQINAQVSAIFRGGDV